MGYEYLIGEKILPAQPDRIIEEGTFTYSSPRKSLEKQTKTIEKHGEKQVESTKYLEFTDKELPPIKNFISERMLNQKCLNKLEKSIRTKNF